MNKTICLTERHPYFLFIKPTITILILLLGHYYIAGQQNATFLLASSSSSSSSFSWHFLTGGKKMYYIDFSEVQDKLEVIQVKSIKGDIVFEDNVADLSDKTYYELNLSKMDDGSYYLELTGKNKAFRKLLKLE